jgi:hypothetical protein
MAESLHVNIHTYAQEKRLHPQTVKRWRAWEDRDQEVLWRLAKELQIGENHLHDLIDWLEEISLRDGETPAEILARQEVQRVLARNLPRNDKLKEVKSELRKLRYPRLFQLEEQLKETVKKMDLGRRVEVRFPPFLEGDEIRVEIRARNAAELKESIERLLEQMEEGWVERLFTLLDEV